MEIFDKTMEFRKLIKENCSSYQTLQEKEKLLSEIELCTLEMESEIKEINIDELNSIIDKIGKGLKK